MKNTPSGWRLTGMNLSALLNEYHLSKSGTSSEYLNKIIEVAEELKSVSRSLRTFNSLKENTSALTRVYQNSLFVEYHSTREDAIHAWKIWSRLRLQLWIS